MPTYDYNFKIILFGDNSAGKQSLTKRYCYNIFNPVERLTIGVDFHVKTLELHGRRIKLQLWDVGGEERFRFLIPNYCLGANAALFVYDITHPSTLNNIAEWVSIVRQKAGAIPIILVGSKLHLQANREITREEGILMVENYNLSAFAEVSARTGQNVNLLFQTLIEILLSPESNPRHVVEIPEAELIIEQVPEDFNERFEPICKEFIVNKYIKLRLEKNKTNIYVGGRLFRQCKYLLLNIPINKISDYTEIESIDEAAEKLDSSMEGRRLSDISPETEFWGHCSNIQAWYDKNYATNLLHRNLAFPLLEALVNAGDPLAKKVFKEEIARRFESGYPTVVLYLIEQGYLDYLNEEELNTILESSTFLENLPKWFSENNIPKWLFKRIKAKLNNSE